MRHSFKIKDYSVTSGLQTVEICCHSAGLAETLAAGQLEVADGIDEEWQRALTHEGIGANFDVHRVMAQQEANPFVHTPKPRHAGNQKDQKCHKGSQFWDMRPMIRMRVVGCWRLPSGNSKRTSCVSCATKTIQLSLFEEA